MCHLVKLSTSSSTRDSQNSRAQSYQLLENAIFPTNNMTSSKFFQLTKKKVLSLTIMKAKNPAGGIDGIIKAQSKTLPRRLTELPLLKPSLTLTRLSRPPLRRKRLSSRPPRMRRRRRSWLQRRLLRQKPWQLLRRRTEKEARRKAAQRAPNSDQAVRWPNFGD